MLNNEMIIDDAITTIHNIISTLDITGDNDKLRATIKVLCKSCLLLLQPVFNRSYYPLMDEDDERVLLGYFIVYCVLNCLYPYTKDGASVHKFINQYHDRISEYCVERCLLYVLHETTDLSNMLLYLTELCYNIF